MNIHNVDKIGQIINQRPQKVPFICQLFFYLLALSNILDRPIVVEGLPLRIPNDACAFPDKDGAPILLMPSRLQPQNLAIFFHVSQELGTRVIGFVAFLAQVALRQLFK